MNFRNFTTSLDGNSMMSGNSMDHNIMNFLGNTDVNIWFTRIIGAIFAVIVELIFYYLWIKRKS
jgi:hypothetical protein